MALSRVKQRDAATGRFRATHGEGWTKLYGVWNQMINRCYRPATKGFANWGGRGVKVCEEWHDFITFRTWALENGYATGLTLDREDVNGDYSLGNCRWVTHQRQMRNIQSTVMLTAWGETKPLRDWAEDPRCLVKYHTAYCRLKKIGWPDGEKILTTLPGMRAL